MVSQKRNEGAQLVAAPEETFAGHRDYKIFKCPKCGQKLRVPRHKGKIAIHCRKCGEEFIRKT